MLHIFERVQKNIPSKLLLVGDGPERNRLESLCREKSLCDLVTFAGKLKDTEGVLSISDLFLLTSESESFGLAALEAMAAGVPVISTNTGGIPEVNLHGKTGFMSQVGNISEMSENALKLLSNPLLHQEFKNNALKQASVFDLHKILPKYESLYQKVLSQ